MSYFNIVVMVEILSVASVKINTACPLQRYSFALLSLEISVSMCAFMFVSRYEDKRKAVLFAPAKVLELPPSGQKNNILYNLWHHCNITKMPLEIRGVLWASIAIYLLWQCGIATTEACGLQIAFMSNLKHKIQLIYCMAVREQQIL